MAERGRGGEAGLAWVDMAAVLGGHAGKVEDFDLDTFAFKRRSGDLVRGYRSALGTSARTDRFNAVDIQAEDRDHASW